MGASQSVPKEATDAEIIADIESRSAMVDKAMTENLSNLSGLLSDFNKNDTESIVKNIKSLEGFKGKLPDSLLDRASKMHRSILDSIDGTLTEDEKKQEVSSNSAVQGFIQRFVDKDLDAKMADYLANPFIQGDPVVQKSMKDVTNSIKSIRGKYKFFEYKYVQMNLFLIVFTKNIHNTVKKFIDETSAFYEAREKYHLVLIHNVVKIFQEQLGDETKKLTDLDTSQFTNAINELASNVMDSIKQQKQVSEKMKADSLAEMLKYLMQRETEFAEEIISGVEAYKSDNPVGANGKPLIGPAVKPGFIAADAFAGEKPGYKFATGAKGNGYYLNAAAAPAPQAVPYGPHRPDFIAADEFEGQRTGYKYSTGDRGRGYYLLKNAATSMTGGDFRGTSMLPQNFYEL